MNLIPIIIIPLLVAADQFTKALAYNRLRPLESITISDGLFSLTYVENTGAAFGLFEGKRWLFVVLTVVILAFMFAYYRRIPRDKAHMWVRFSLILIASGAVGNFIDRFRNGYVVDFLHFQLIDFPVFNIADCFVCIGAFLLSFLLIFVIKDEPNKSEV